MAIRYRTHSLLSRRVAVGSLVLASIPLIPQPALAHGTLHTPPSRVLLCRFADSPENPQDPACAAAVADSGSPQFLYDWAGIRQGDADGQHQAVVPDGELCSGGGPEYRGLDLVRDDWRRTAVAPEADGTFEFIYLASAPHATRDMLFYITPDGWDSGQPLTWQDLDADPGSPGVQPFCHLTSATLESLPEVGDVYRMRCPLPARSGRHTIYHVWQRSDSPEAFYACVDVVMEAPGWVFGDDFESGLEGWSAVSGGPGPIETPGPIAVGPLLYGEGRGGVCEGGH
ncbi:MAG: lytic polysaccharide monooxygenase auxiliary activity family 9 protein [Acidobacteriota bacterium]